MQEDFFASSGNDAIREDSADTKHDYRSVPEQTELELMREIANKLIKAGWLVIRINSGLVKIEGNAGYFRPYIVYGLNASSGFPDLIAFKGNQYFCVEVKLNGKRLTEAQVKFFKYAKACGLQLHICTSVASALKVAEELCKH